MVSLRTLEKGLFIATLALVACNKEEDSDTDSGGDDTSDTSPIYLEPYWFGVDASFAYDATNNKVVAYSGTASTGSFTQNPAIAVTLFEQGASDNEAGDEICTILADQAGPIDAVTTFGTNSDVLIGFQLDWSAATITAPDCEGLLDPDIWGEDLSNIKGVDWGIGITAPIDSHLSDLIEEQVSADTSADWAADWEPYLIGARPFFSTTGTIFSDGGDPEEFYFGFGSAVDGSFALVIDGDDQTTPLLVSDITDGSIPNGAYNTQYAFLLNFGMPLAEGVLIPAPE